MIPDKIFFLMKIYFYISLETYFGGWWELSCEAVLIRNYNTSFDVEKQEKCFILFLYIDSWKFFLSYFSFNNHKQLQMNINSPFLLPWKKYTLQPLYNTVRYNTVLDITQSKDGSQKCIDYIENDHKWSFFNIIYTFLFGYNTVV